MIKYTDAVREGKAMLKQDEQNEWRWGEIASNLEPKYGEATLEHYAKDVNKSYSSLRVYESMWRAWEGTETARRLAISSAVAIALIAYGRKKDEVDGVEKAKERREKLVKDKPDMTEKEARKQTHRWKEQHGPKTDLNLHQLVMRVVNILDHILDEESNPKLNSMLDAVVTNLGEIDEDDRKLLVASIKGVVERAEDLGKQLRPNMRSAGSNVVNIKGR